MNKAILLFICPDQRGLVTRISSFIYKRKGNVLSLNEFVDTDTSTFFLRVSWDMEGFNLNEAGFRREFNSLAVEFQANWEVYFSDRREKVAIIVSKYDHCLRDILWRHGMNEFPVEIPLIISNHPNLQHIGERYNIPYFIFPLKPAHYLPLARYHLPSSRVNSDSHFLHNQYDQTHLFQN